MAKFKKKATKRTSRRTGSKISVEDIAIGAGSKLVDPLISAAIGVAGIAPTAAGYYRKDWGLVGAGLAEAVPSIMAKVGIGYPTEGGL